MALPSKHTTYGPVPTAFRFQNVVTMYGSIPHVCYWPSNSKHTTCGLVPTAFRFQNVVRMYGSIPHVCYWSRYSKHTTIIASYQLYIEQLAFRLIRVITIYLLIKSFMKVRRHLRVSGRTKITPFTELQHEILVFYDTYGHIH